MVCQVQARYIVHRQWPTTFICVIGLELVQKYVWEDAHMAHELFKMAWCKKTYIILFNVVGTPCGARFDNGTGSVNEVQRTMLGANQST